LSKIYHIADKIAIKGDKQWNDSLGGVL